MRRSAMSKYLWLILMAYPALGLALGLADPWLGGLMRQAGLRPGVATALTVNAILPFAAIGLGALHRRAIAAVLGAAAMTIGLVAGLAVCYAAPGGRSFVGVVAAVPPVLYLASLGYAALGISAALVVRRLRSLSA
jgi:hypothetical protein